jgi:hypothetical protein
VQTTGPKEGPAPVPQGVKQHRVARAGRGRHVPSSLNLLTTDALKGGIKIGVLQSRLTHRGGVARLVSVLDAGNGFEPLLLRLNGITVDPPEEDAN